MNNLDEEIKKKKEILNIAISTKGIMDKYTIQISQQLDNLIVEKMRNELKEAKNVRWQYKKNKKKIFFMRILQNKVWAA